LSKTLDKEQDEKKREEKVEEELAGLMMILLSLQYFVPIFLLTLC
jgi:hypothetical protein